MKVALIGRRIGLVPNVSYTVCVNHLLEGGVRPHPSNPTQSHPTESDRAEPNQTEPNQTQPKSTSPSRSDGNRDGPHSAKSERNRTGPNSISPNRTEPNRSSPNPTENRTENPIQLNPPGRRAKSSSPSSEARSVRAALSETASFATVRVSREGARHTRGCVGFGSLEGEGVGGFWEVIGFQTCQCHQTF